MRLAPATPADAPALARILGDWVRDTPWMPGLHSRDEDVAFLRGLIDRTQVFALHRTAPEGFIAVEGNEVPAFYLATGMRGQGWGKALLGHVRQGRDRLALWTFQANTGARRFYAREGFREVARTAGENEERLPDVRLLWERGAP